MLFNDCDAVITPLVSLETYIFILTDNNRFPASNNKVPSPFPAHLGLPKISGHAHTTAGWQQSPARGMLKAHNRIFPLWFS